MNPIISDKTKNYHWARLLIFIFLVSVHPPFYHIKLVLIHTYHKNAGDRNDPPLALSSHSNRRKSSHLGKINNDKISFRFYIIALLLLHFLFFLLLFRVPTAGRACVRCSARITVNMAAACVTAKRAGRAPSVTSRSATARSRIAIGTVNACVVPAFAVSDGKANFAQNVSIVDFLLVVPA